MKSIKKGASTIIHEYAQIMIEIKQKVEIKINLYLCFNNVWATLTMLFAL